ncbi:DUF2309 domain-containing protein [Salisaeta longa]|uniref:DUF2309 domain-containing protein n=1 Tax=Salisaeta longa TaxID=503170 RepID=UPI0003B5BB35|nr:DUF2309 domain-containing protein [Salisaeta longa]
MPIERTVLRARIENAAAAIGPLWPLPLFNSSNPLSGLEDQPFAEAVRTGQRLFGGRAYPAADCFRTAWAEGAIEPDILTQRLSDAGFAATPEALLDQMDRAPAPAPPPDETLNQLLTEWLAAFADRGQATWPMPERGDGFYAAWRALAPHERALPTVRDAMDLPETSWDALRAVLADHPEPTWERLFTHHLAALPGWTGHIRWRMQAEAHDWQSEAPLTLIDYLAVRLTAATLLDRPITPPDDAAAPDASEHAALAQCWLAAWEESARRRLLDRLDPSATNAPAERPDAQLVFCIDVRSEIIRRHIEHTGAYETHGYAGFFGLPIALQTHDEAHPHKACPPIVDPRHRIAEDPRPEAHAAADRYARADAWRATGTSLLKTLKHDVAAAFGFVEGSGGFFGGALAGRTLAPLGLAAWRDRLRRWVPAASDVAAPAVARDPDRDNGLPYGLTHDAQVLYAEAAFRLMGWTDRFAPVVVFTGHGAQTPNNPYKASLDCGACAGAPGGPNARVLAALCNTPAVRDALRERGIAIPEDTVFLAAEHNTTTDAVTLYDDATDRVAPEALNRLRDDLSAAQSKAAAERAATLPGGGPATGRDDARRRAHDWAETRPEWGLAGNYAFIIGPRALSQDTSLDGRVFLHSYNWQTDPDGTALETIMTGPLVVGEWINMQYYFSTIDNAAYGSGSKITQNVTGRFGLIQGNGGDLMSGLPLQSLYASDTMAHHAPLRLWALVHAPRDRVEAILNQQYELKRLLDHRWMSLAVVDPSDATVHEYQPGGTWHPRAAPAPAPSA